MKTHRFLSLLLLLAAAAHADALKDHLSVFFEMEAKDSVVALEQKSPTLLWITVADPATGVTRVLKEEVGAKPMQKLLIESNDKGLKTIYMTSSDDAGDAPADTAKAQKTGEPIQSIYADAPKPAAGPAPGPARPASASSLSSQRKNRMWYMTYQTLASTYVYGFALPFAYDNVSTKTRIATPMIVAPLAFGANFFFAKDRPFEDSHLKGTTYLSVASLYASHALPFSLIGWDDWEDIHPYRVTSYLSMVAYPLGIWGGYKLGGKYVEQPGRIDTQTKFALGFGALGFFTPFLYFEDVDGNGEAITRLGLGQSLALATAGHFIADQYRQGENIPDGVNTGILHHSLLGAAAGLEIAALSDASTARPWLGSAILGGTLGFMEGLWYYRKSYDSKERGLYNSLGMGAGALMGYGFFFLSYDDDDSRYKFKSMLTSFLVGGVWAGYLAINLLTDGMEDRGAAKPDSWTDRLAVNLIPMPEPVMRDKEMYLRYRVQGMTYRF